MAQVATTRKRKGFDTDVWEFANDAKETMVRIPKKITKKIREELVGQVALLEVMASETFGPASHLCALVTGYDERKRKFIVQPFNRSGDRDGTNNDW